MEPQIIGGLGHQGTERRTRIDATARRERLEYLSEMRQLFLTPENQLPGAIGIIEAPFEHVLDERSSEVPEPYRGSESTVFRNSPVNVL